MEIVYALLCLITGASLLFGGYRLARLAIAFWGFVAGMSVGGTIIANMSGVPFLGTVIGVFTGIALGLLFALLAYLYYAAAVLVLAGAAGYWAGSSFITLLGFDTGILSVTIGVVLGLLTALLALTAEAPKYLLIFISAMAGAMAVIGGLLLMFNQIPLDSFNYAAVNHTVSNSFIWTLSGLLLTILGIIVQSRTTGHYNMITWAYGSDEGGQSLPKHTANVH